MDFAPTSIRADTRGDERWLEVHGDLDIDGAAALRSAVEECLGDPPEAVIVDLTDCDFVDSLGLSELLRCGRDAHLAGAALRVLAPHGHQARVLMDLSGTAGALQVIPA